MPGQKGLLELFTNYAAGKGMPESAFRSFLKQRKLNRETDRERKRQEQELMTPGEGVRVGGRKSNPNGEWILIRQHKRQGDYVQPFDVEVLYRFNAANNMDAHVVLDQYRQEYNQIGRAHV